MNAIRLTLEGATLIAETEDRRTRIHFRIRQNTTTLIIDDYTIERFETPFDAAFALPLMHALKKRGIRHVLTDELPDGMLPWCRREGDTLHCDLADLD